MVQKLGEENECHCTVAVFSSVDVGEQLMTDRPSTWQRLASDRLTYGIDTWRSTHITRETVQVILGRQSQPALF